MHRPRPLFIVAASRPCPVLTRGVASAIVLLAAMSVAGCGFSVPGTADAESSDSETADPNLGLATTDTAMSPGMHSPTPAMPGAMPSTMPSAPMSAPTATPGADQAAAMQAMHGANAAAAGTAAPHAALPPMPGFDPAAAPAANPSPHAALPPMPGVDPATAAADPAGLPANPGFNPGANPAVPGAAPAGVDPAAMEAAMRARQEAAAGAAPDAEGAIPGQGPQGGSRADKYDASNPERVVFEFADALENGDVEAAGKLISDRARGALASIREGSISENELAKLKAYTATLDRVGARNSGSGVQLNYNAGSDKVLQFKVGKGSSGFQITELEIRDKPKRAGR